MPTRYDSEDDLRDSGSGDREISLGTGTVLGIFLALALVCSLFFGLGYSMGKKSAPALSSMPVAAPSTLTSAEIEKPSPGSPSAAQEESSPRTLRSDLQVAQPVEESSSGPGSPQPGIRPSSHDRSAALKSPSAGLAPASPITPTVTNPQTGPQSFVQVAAVSRKEDADLLLSALKRRGYTGLIRQQQDKLLHVQVGPFPTRKDAEAMRQRLIVDGYNPIIK